MFVQVDGNNNVVVTLIMPQSVADKKMLKIHRAFKKLEYLIKLRNSGLVDNEKYILQKNILIMSI